MLSGLLFLTLLRLGQSQYFGHAFDTTENICASMSCLRSQFSVAFFLIQTNNEINPVGYNNYRNALNYYNVSD